MICSDILLPSHAPPEYADRQTLWNAVEKAERGNNAQLAYIFDIALQLSLIHISPIGTESRPTDSRETDLMTVGKPSPNQTNINNPFWEFLSLDHPLPAACRPHPFEPARLGEFLQMIFHAVG